MEATAKYDYEAEAGDELSFKKGERLKILQTTGNWYKAELHGSDGFVPKNFINIHLPSWYQEDYSRSDAEEKLMLQPVGAFIIRGSRNVTQSDFSISVRHAAGVQHFKVLRDSRGQYFLWSKKFSSLNQLVEYYKNTSISKEDPVLLNEMGQQQRRRSDSLPPLPPSPISECPPTPAPRQHTASSNVQVRALYSFHAKEKDELEFNAGDIIEVLESSEQAWWKGLLRGKTGLFPSNYTRPI
ncbi:GRB2-related adaptor protein 2 [Etheostoma spectabile]|uniref:GRB2-related adaptor protein 2 n=1 Tax=Etheostoma spectabile TaxID=54343 RepID=UPI0013AF1E74|nr:GRB2-related adaptor protein 2-like [Etheostoma spectabile]